MNLKTQCRSQDNETRIEETKIHRERFESHTWEFDWLLEIIKVKLGKHAKPVVVFQKDKLWLLIITSISLQHKGNEKYQHCFFSFSYSLYDSVVTHQEIPECDENTRRGDNTDGHVTCRISKQLRCQDIGSFFRIL